MRGVAGMLFVFVGLVMGYMILSGKFPGNVTTGGGTPIYGQNANNTRPGNIQGIQEQQQNRRGDGTSGGPLGLPTMQHLQDLGASQGGMR